MEARIPIGKRLKTEIKKEIQNELDAQYIAGQCAQRDLDMLAMHIAFGFGAKRLAEFNDTANELVKNSNQWFHDDPKDGAEIASERIRSELEKIPGFVAQDSLKK